MLPEMPPPGLTCTECQQPFKKGLATRTDRGWCHARRCPRVRTDWIHFEIEDVEWMAATGECLSMAAIRLGYSNPKAFERRLERLGRRDLVRQLALREGDWNKPSVMAREGAA